MKTITINVSEPVYRDFQEISKLQDRSTSEIIREAMEFYRQQKLRVSRSMHDMQPFSVGSVLQPLQSTEDLLEEMLHDRH